jgi:hypothetical protein
MLNTLGGVPGKDQIAGFIYIGEKITTPNERTRPKLETIVSYL